MDQNGKLRPEGRICWSEAPAEVVIQKPYALALLPRFLEVAKYLVSNCLVMKNKFQAYFSSGTGCASLHFMLLAFADSISTRSISIDTNSSFSKCTPSSPEQ